MKGKEVKAERWLLRVKAERRKLKDQSRYNYYCPMTNDHQQLAIKLFVTFEYERTPKKAFTFPLSPFSFHL